MEMMGVVVVAAAAVVAEVGGVAGVVVSEGFSFGSFKWLQWKIKQSGVGSRIWMLLIMSQLVILTFQSLENKQKQKRKERENQKWRKTEQLVKRWTASKDTR